MPSGGENTENTENPPAPDIFTIFRLPSYEDAVKSSGEPPSYEQALTDRRVEDFEISVPDNTENNQTRNAQTIRDRRRNQRRVRNRRVYKCFCWGLSILILLVLGYMIYMGIFRYMSKT